MEITKLKENDIYDFSKLAREIILKSPYYSDFSKRIYIKDFSTKKVRKDLKDKNILLIVAKEGGEIIGFIRGFFEHGRKSGIFWLHWIGVDTRYRGKGVAQKMLDYLINKLKSIGLVHKIVCVVRPQNMASLGLFKENNFRKLAFLKKHWYKEDFYYWYKYI